MNKTEKNEAIKKTRDWWMCDNIVHPNNKKCMGLLHLNFPFVFILIRDYDQAYMCSFNDWKTYIAEINFLIPSQKPNSPTEIEVLLIDAWNFMALQEEKEEEIYEQNLNDSDNFK